MNWPLFFYAIIPRAVGELQKWMPASYLVSDYVIFCQFAILLDEWVLGRVFRQILFTT